MNEDLDSTDIEFATAVASAAFAIRSQEETDTQYQKKKKESLQTLMTKVNSRKDETTAFPPSITRRLSNKETNLGNFSIYYCVFIGDLTISYDNFLSQKMSCSLQ